MRDRRIRFLLVGGSSAGIELAVFQLAVLAGLGAVLANIVSFTVSLFVSFAGYKIWSFSGDHVLGIHSQFGAYLSLALINATATSFLIHGLTAWGLVPWAAKVLCMVLVAIWNYGLLSRLVFRRTSAVKVDGLETKESGGAAE